MIVGFPKQQTCTNSRSNIEKSWTLPTRSATTFTHKFGSLSSFLFSTYSSHSIGFNLSPISTTFNCSSPKSLSCWHTQIHAICLIHLLLLLLLFELHNKFLLFLSLNSFRVFLKCETFFTSGINFGFHAQLLKSFALERVEEPRGNVSAGWISTKIDDEQTWKVLIQFVSNSCFVHGRMKRKRNSNQQKRESTRKMVVVWKRTLKNKHWRAYQEFHAELITHLSFPLQTPFQFNTFSFASRTHLFLPSSIFVRPQKIIRFPSNIDSFVEYVILFERKTFWTIIHVSLLALI